MKIKKFITNPIFLIITSAVLSSLPLTFDNLFFISWVSFVPLFYAIINNASSKLRHSLGKGFLFGFVYYLCIYYWFLWFYPLDFAGLSTAASIAVVALAWVGISLVHGVLWCIPTLVCHFLKKKTNSPAFLSFAAIIGIIGAEKLTLVGDLAFPWARISLGQYSATALIQSASLFGADGVDILILVINALLTLCFIYPPKKRVISVLVAITIFCTNLGFGIIRLNNQSNSQKIDIMTVQASVEQSEKWSYNGDTICFNRYSSLTKDNITNSVDLVLWPESAVPTVYENEDSLRLYKKIAKDINTPLLAGVLFENGGPHTNSAALITQNGDITSYAKRQLVPFGEYMPYQKILSTVFPFLAQLNIIEQNYVSGNDTAIMQLNDAHLGTIICFESIYPNLARQSVLDGAELLIEATNDSWLKDSPAMYQHLAHGVFRSVENGRSLIRSANSGVSATIDTRGRIQKMLEPNVTGVITDSVYLSTEQTLYTKTGDILFPICVIFALIWFVTLLIKGKKLVNE